LIEEDMAMTDTANRKPFELDYLLHPAGAFRTPMAVVNDLDLTTHEKRAILASWASDTWVSDNLASDACADEATAELRQPPATAPVAFDDIIEALKQLDGDVAWQPNYGRFINRARRWKDLYRKDRGGRSLFG
jgi:hypothetical protein